MIQSKKTIASILFVLISFVCSAQTPPPPQPPPGPVGVPIDSSIIVLLIIGLLYGVYKMYLLRKEAL